jgi:hypothetical protein
MIKIYKVLWSNHDERDATWETRAYLKEVSSDFYNKWLVTQNLGTRFFQGERAITPLVLSMHLHLHFRSISIIYAYMSIT